MAEYGGAKCVKESKDMSPKYKQPTGATPIETSRGTQPMPTGDMVKPNNQTRESIPMKSEKGDNHKVSDVSKRDYPAS